MHTQYGCPCPCSIDPAAPHTQLLLTKFPQPSWHAAGTNYVETLRVQIHANCRIRRIYFSDRLYAEEDLPAEFKLFLPIQNKTSAAAAAN